ncbi:MAG: HlyD family efflux transporter periplasmic adaptor subunit [Minisyncoccia bacterium]
MNRLISSFISYLTRFAAWFSAAFSALWARYRALSLWKRIAIPVLAVVVLIGVNSILRKGTEAEAGNTPRTVTLESVGMLANAEGNGISVIGNVRSVTEASLYAQSGGAVEAVHTSLGASVPAGFVIAEFDNASQAAAVLQAEGAYEAALASRAAVSSSDVKTDAYNTYREAFDTLTAIIEDDIDLFFGSPTAFGPNLLINAGPNEVDELPRARAALETDMETWRDSLGTASTRNPQELFAEADSITRSTSDLLTKLSASAYERNSRATATQLAGLTTAQSGINTLLATIASAKEGYRSGSVGTTASVDAAVKQALGVLRGAQANFEKTVVRAPIAGVVNFLPIRAGDYVAPSTHVATVAQNGSLEIIAYVSEDDRALFTPAQKVIVNGTYDGVVTSLAPALNPETKQVEIHIGVAGQTNLVNGASVRITVPSMAATPVATQGPIMLPLAAVKLSANERIIFTVDSENRLVANPVTVGDVRGDRIEITSPLSADLHIVTDARGLGEGEKINVATATPATL